jgi:hypothetical protein
MPGFHGMAGVAIDFFAFESSQVFEIETALLISEF